MSAAAVYRFYNTDGELLYVGLTNNPNRRFTEHADTNEQRRAGECGCSQPPANERDESR